MNAVFVGAIIEIVSKLLEKLAPLWAAFFAGRKSVESKIDKETIAAKERLLEEIKASDDHSFRMRTDAAYAERVRNELNNLP
jgi:hypothetical protein